MSPVPWPRRGWASSVAQLTVPTTTETVLVTSSPISLDGPSQQLLIVGYALVQTGTGTTVVTLRVRRGAGATGPIVGDVANETAIGAAGSTDPYTIAVVDAPGEVAGLQYTLTVQQTAATGNGSVWHRVLEVVVLS